MRILLLLAFACIASGQTANYTIAGTVLDSSSKRPLAGVALAVVPSAAGRESSRRVALTAADGRFSISGLPAGKYQFFAQALGYPQQLLNEHEGYSSAVVTGPGKDSEHVLFPLQRGGRITGTVLDEAGEPVQHAIALLFPIKQAEGNEQVIAGEMQAADDRGIYKFFDVKPGRYYLAIYATPWYVTDPREAVYTPDLDVTYPITFIGGATDERSATPFTVKPGDHVVQDFSLVPVRSIHVYLPGKAREGESLMLTRRLFGRYGSPAGVGNVVNTSQRFFGGLAPGTYFLAVNRVDEKQQGMAAFRGTTMVPVEITGDMTIDPSQLTSVQCKISGIVSFTGGQHPNASSMAMLTFLTDGDELAGITPVGAEGKFDSTLAPGTYRVGIRFANSEAQIGIADMIASGSVRVDGQRITVSSGSGTLAFTATDQLATITGTVLDNGKPVSGAMVILIPEKGVAKKELVRRDESDSDGTFTLRLIPEGKYTLLALKNGWDLHWAEPGVLDPYLKAGVPVQITGTVTKTLTINAQ